MTQRVITPVISRVMDFRTTLWDVSGDLGRVKMLYKKT